MIGVSLSLNTTASKGSELIYRYGLVVLSLLTGKEYKHDATEYRDQQKRD